MVYDYSLLRGRIKQCCGTEGEFALRIGRSRNYISNVFLNKSIFSQDDIKRAADVLEIEADKIGEYFFVLA